MEGKQGGAWGFPTGGPEVGSPGRYPWWVSLGWYTGGVPRGVPQGGPPEGFPRGFNEYFRRAIQRGFPRGCLQWGPQGLVSRGVNW